jgi:hypothetical protein
MSQLKIALQKMNLVTTSEYKTLKAWATPETVISIAREDGLKKYVIPAVYHKETSKPEFIPTVSNSKMFDVVDLIEVWDNRHSRTESRLYDAMNELNSEVGNKTFFKPSEVDKLGDEDRKRLNKKLYAIARYNNMLDRMTQLNGNYSNPLEIYCHNETIQEARKKLSSDKHFEDVLALASSNDNLSEKNKKVIQRFRDRNNLYYRVYDDKGNCIKSEMMTRDNLIYLCK